MKQSRSSFFKDETFPIRIDVNLTSNIDREGYHEALEIKYFYEGNTTLLLGEKSLSVGPGDVVVINPYEPHSTINYDKNNKGKYHRVMIGLDFFEGVRAINTDLRHIVFDKQTVFKSLHKENKKLEEILCELATFGQESSHINRLETFALVTKLVANLLKFGVDEDRKYPRPETINHYKTVEPAIRTIRDHFQERLTLDTLAAACSVSKYHFCRVFKDVMGMSAIQYLNFHRLKIANAMLASSNERINEIALFCGFDDPAYFSKAYKELFGTTPRKVRNK